MPKSKVKNIESRVFVGNKDFVSLLRVLRSLQKVLGAKLVIDDGEHVFEY